MCPVTVTPGKAGRTRLSRPPAWGDYLRDLNKLYDEFGYSDDSGLEPSCTAVFRSDAAELFPGDQDVLRLRDHTKTLAELLTEHLETGCCGLAGNFGFQPGHGGRDGMHLAELLATAGSLDYDRPEQVAAPRPAEPGVLAKAAVLTALAAVAGGAGAGLARLLRGRRG
jgi:hypothetical protein